MTTIVSVICVCSFCPVQERCVFTLTSYIFICFRLYRKVNYPALPTAPVNFARPVCMVDFITSTGFVCFFVSNEINGKWRLLVNKMSVSTALHSQLATVMESLVHAAVAELKRLMEGRSQLLLGLELRCRSPGQEPPQVDKVQVDSGEAMVRG